MKLSADKQTLLQNITEDLKEIDGIQAIVLGGSYAVGRATESSDLDIGIYYFEQSPFDIEAVTSIANKYADNDKPTVTGLYEWGPWVNGGAWIKTTSGEVDLLHKNIDHITQTIDNAIKGIWENHFEQQPPYGFSSITFLAETQSSISLHDPAGILKELKKRIQHYPQKLQQSVIQQSLWSAEFTIWQAETFANTSDMYNTVGCLTRAVKSIVATLFALNELYPMGDKRAIEILEQTRRKPANLTRRVNDILSCENNTVRDNVQQLKILFHETVGLADEQYKPYYKL